MAPIKNHLLLSFPILLITCPPLIGAELTPINNAYRYFNRLQKTDQDKSAGTEHGKKGFDDLGWAIHRYDAAQAEKILGLGRNPNHQLWSHAQRHPFVCTVVERSANPTRIDLKCACPTVVYEQTEFDNQKILDLLLKHKANVNVGKLGDHPYEYDAHAPLWSALRTGRPDIARKLVDAGATVSFLMICQAHKQEADFKKYYEHLEKELPGYYRKIAAINASMVKLLEEAYEGQKPKNGAKMVAKSKL